MQKTYPNPRLARKQAQRIYVASKSRYADLWCDFREYQIPIISSWIDQGGKGMIKSWPRFWAKCILQAVQADVIIVYVDPRDEPMKGAYVEVGAALAAGVPVIVVINGSLQQLEDSVGSWYHHPLVKVTTSLQNAFLMVGYAVE